MKIFKNSFLKNGILEFLSQALIVLFRLVLKIWSVRKPYLRIFAKSYENCHICFSVKLRWWKIFEKSLEISWFWIKKVASFKIKNSGSVGVKWKVFENSLFISNSPLDRFSKQGAKFLSLRLVARKNFNNIQNIKR